MSVAKRFIDRTILAKIYANDKCADYFYATLPVTPHGPSDESVWRRNSRPEVPDFVKGLLHYEVAVPADKHRILEFLMANVIPSSPMFNSLGANPTELFELYEPIVERTLKDHCSLLGFKGDELIAVSLNSIKNVEPTSNKTSTVDIVPSKDYSSEIDAGKFKSRAANKVACFAKVLREKFEKLLPMGAQKICFIEIGGICQQFRGQGISQEMVKHSMELARLRFHCDYICTMADSKPAQTLFEQKLGYSLLRELQLDHFLDGKNVVFSCDTNELVSGKLLCKHL